MKNEGEYESGLHLVYLPFGDDIRHIPTDPSNIGILKYAYQA